MLPLSVALLFFNISVSVMCEKCIFALYIYDNIFRVTIDATIYTNTLCSNEDYEMYETHTNSQCERRYFDTYAKSFSPFSIEKPSRSVYRKIAHPIQRTKMPHVVRTRGWTCSYLVKRFLWHVQKCTYYPISFDDRQYRLINSRTLSF